MQKPLVPAVCGLLYLVVFWLRFLQGSLKQFVAAGRLSVAPDELLSPPEFPWPISAAGRLSVAPDELLRPPVIPAQPVAVGRGLVEGDGGIFAQETQQQVSAVEHISLAEDVLVYSVRIGWHAFNTLSRARRRDKRASLSSALSEARPLSCASGCSLRCLSCEDWVARRTLSRV